MVQYKPICTCGPSPCTCDCNTYWKLGAAQKWFREQNYYVSRKTATKASTLDAVGRGLPTKDIERTVPDLARTLERADDEATFDRFLELPPEIRNMIYEFHLWDFGTVPEIHHQPPITLAFSQLRKETRELFYHHCTFSVTLNRLFRNHLSYNRRTQTMLNKLTPCLSGTRSKSPLTRLLSFCQLNPVTPNDLSLIKRLEFHFPRNAVVSGLHVPGDFTVVFDFTPGLQDDETVRMDFDKDMCKRQRWKGRFPIIEAHLREAFGWVVREMILRHEGQRFELCKDDFDVLLAALR